MSQEDSEIKKVIVPKIEKFVPSEEIIVSLGLLGIANSEHIYKKGNIYYLKEGDYPNSPQLSGFLCAEKEESVKWGDEELFYGPGKIILLPENPGEDDSGTGLLDKIKALGQKFGLKQSSKKAPPTNNIKPGTTTVFPLPQEEVHPLPLPVGGTPTHKLPPESKVLVETRHWQQVLEQAQQLQSSQGILDSDYQSMRDELVAAATTNGNPAVRRFISGAVATLASKGFDPEFTRALGAIVKKILKTDSEGVTKITPEAAMCLRVLCSLNTPDSNRLLCRLLTDDGLDNRVKKIVLASLRKHNFFGPQVSRDVVQLLKTDSDAIPWSRFEPIVAVARLPSRRLREQVVSAIDSSFSSLINHPEDWDEISRGFQAVPSEAVLQVYEISRSQGIPPAKFNELFSQIKGNQTREELVIILTSFLIDDSDYHFSEINKRDRAGLALGVLMASPIIREEVPVFMGALKKMSFLINELSQDPERYIRVFETLLGIQNPAKSKARLDNRLVASSRIASQYAGTMADLNHSLDGEVQNVFSRIFRKDSINVSTLEKLQSVWGDVEALFMYASRLRQCDNNHTLGLVAEIVENLDPPEMTRWKKWRYNMGDMRTKKQLEGLFHEQVEAYSRDILIDVNEVTLGVNPTDGPVRIREVLAHLLTQHPLDAATAPMVLSTLGEVFSRNPTESQEFNSDIKNLQERTERELHRIQEVVALQADLRIASRATETLSKWHKNEARKREELVRFGYPAEFDEAEVTAEVERLRQTTIPVEVEQEVEKLIKDGTVSQYQKLSKLTQAAHDNLASISGEEAISLEVAMSNLRDHLGDNWQGILEAHRTMGILASCTPKKIDLKLSDFLNKYSLSATSSAGEIEAARESVALNLETSLHTAEFLEIDQKYNTNNSSEKGRYETINNLRVIAEVARLAQVDARALSYDRLFPEDPHNDTSLSQVVGHLEKSLSGSGSSSNLSEDIERLKDVIKSNTPETKQQNLMFVFTDNPLVALTVGRYPNGATSCQTYWGGSSSLAAYAVDSMTKATVLIDKSKLPDTIVDELSAAASEGERLEIFNRSTQYFLDAIVARRITKIVKRDREEGQPVVFLEPVYTPFDRASMTRLMNICAVNTLQPAIGLPLVKGGNDFAVYVPASKNTEQYEDGQFGGPDNGGLGSKSGDYEMRAASLSMTDFGSL